MDFFRPFAEGRSHVPRLVSDGHRSILPTKTVFDITNRAGLLRMMEAASSFDFSFEFFVSKSIFLAIDDSNP
jgi:hypothetical protein